MTELEPKRGPGRPMGAKDSRPRIKRADILNARREEWDKWERNTGALKRARSVLLQIMEDPKATNSDRLKAIQMLEDRGMGKVTEEREAQPVQVLQIIRATAEGFARLNPGREYETREVDE